MEIICQLRGVVTLLLIIANTIIWMFPLFISGLLKFLSPAGFIRRSMGRAVVCVCHAWNRCNLLIFALLQKTRWNVTGNTGLDPRASYVVLANHQTWVDILVLEKAFLGKIPFLRFFIKKELMWIPVLGFSWWALDFPVMKRYSAAELEKKPHLKGKDLETTRQACEKFKKIPVSVMNFAEGTRFTPEKHKRQQSPFERLLRPRAGGTSFVISALGEYIHSILDVTIVYPEGVKTIWEFACGAVDEIIVRIERIELSPDLIGDYFNDPAYRDHIRNWLNGIWEKKDRRIREIVLKREALKN